MGKLSDAAFLEMLTQKDLLDFSGEAISSAPANLTGTFTDAHNNTASEDRAYAVLGAAFKSDLNL